MPKSIRPKNIDPAIYLTWLFQKTEQAIIAEILHKRERGLVEYAEVAALARIQADLQDMVDQSSTYVPKMIERRFYGTNKDLSGYANAAKIAGRTNMVMMETLTDNLMGEIVEAAGKAATTARTLYTIARLDNDELRKAALTNTAFTEALGKGAYTTSELMEATIRNHGITAFVDKAGRQWSLTDYCNMAARTTARQAEVAGVLSADEHDLYQIVKIGTTCPVCAVYEGRVYSKSGMNPNYPPLSMAFGKIDPAGGDDLSNTYLNIHPNCLHSLIKFTEMGKTEKQLQKIREFSSPETNPLTHDPRSKKQVEEYREKERRRAELLKDMREMQEYRAILGNKVTKDITKFRDIKYNNRTKWEPLKREFTTVKSIKSKAAWTDEFRQKALDTYYQFRKEGIEASAHAVARFLDRSRGAYTFNDVVTQWRMAPNYIQADGRFVKYYNGLAIAYDPDTKEIVSFINRKKPRANWVERNE